MKTILIIALLVSFAMSTAVTNSCSKDKYCNSCDSSGNCTMCYSYGGKINPKKYNSTSKDCKVDRTQITDCKYYGTSGSTSTTYENTCIYCNGKTWLNITGTTYTCSDTPIETAKTTCNSTAITGCSQLICHKNGNTYTKACQIFSLGYEKGSGTATLNSTTQFGTTYYTNTATAGTIANCSMHYFATSTKCLQCDSGKSVANSETACTNYTADTNCRKLNSTGGCEYCNYEYYFDATTCKMRSNLITQTGIALAIMMFFN